MGTIVDPGSIATVRIDFKGELVAGHHWRKVALQDAVENGAGLPARSFAGSSSNRSPAERKKVHPLRSSPRGVAEVPIEQQE